MFEKMKLRCELLLDRQIMKFQEFGYRVIQNFQQGWWNGIMDTKLILKGRQIGRALDSKTVAVSCEIDQEWCRPHCCILIKQGLVTI